MAWNLVSEPDVKPASSWVPFSQREELTVRLRNILEEYAFGPGIFKEFLQNADDARASRLVLIVDEGTYTEASLLDPRLAAWQGPAVFAFNDAVFSDQDFEGICSLGASVKRADYAKIGRYGLGFNTVYHLTDVVSFISRDQFCIFDPHQSHLPESLPGLRLPIAEVDAKSRFEGQFAPFEAAAEALNVSLFPLKGALFRMPLRCQKQAQASRICKESRTATQLVEVLIEMLANAHELLLFLQSVRSVEAVVIRPLADGKRMIFRLGGASLRAATEGVAQRWLMERRLLANAVDQSSAMLQTALAFVIDAEVYSTSEDGVRKLQMETTVWLVVMRSEPLGFAESEGEVGGEGDELPPRRCAAVALRLWPPLLDAPMDGLAFCFLPLSLRTGLPMHVNGNFALTANRRDLWRGGEDLAASSKAARRAAWNDVLLESTLPQVITNALALRVVGLSAHLSGAENMRSVGAPLRGKQRIGDKLSAKGCFGLIPLLDLVPPGPWDKYLRTVSCDPRELWEMWPSKGEGAFARLPVAVASHVVRANAPVFWDSRGGEGRHGEYVSASAAWLCADTQHDFFSPALQSAFGRLRVARSNKSSGTGGSIVSVPQRVCVALEAVPGVDWLRPKALATSLRTPSCASIDFTVEEADALVSFLLHAAIDDDEGGFYFHSSDGSPLSVLHGLRLAPLEGGGLGRFDSPKNEDFLWLTDDADMMALIPKGRFVARQSNIFKWLRKNGSRNGGLLNVCALDNLCLHDVLPQILPSCWKGKSVVSWCVEREMVLVDGEEASRVQEVAAMDGYLVCQEQTQSARRHRQVLSIKKGGGKLAKPQLRGNRSGWENKCDSGDDDAWDEDWQEDAKWHASAASAVSVQKGSKAVAMSSTFVCSCTTLLELELVGHRCDLLWKLLESVVPSKASVGSLPGFVWDFPCIRPAVEVASANGDRLRLISANEALRRYALAQQDFSAQERAVFASCGVTYLHAGPRLHRALKIDRTTTLQALKFAFARRTDLGGSEDDRSADSRLMAGMKPCRLPIEMARQLREILRDLLRGQRLGFDIRLFEVLPIFETVGGRFAVPLAPPSHSVLAPDDDWDKLLRPWFSDYLVDFANIGGEFLAEIAYSRPAKSTFLGEFLAPRVGHLNEELCLNFLEEVATLRGAPWKRTGVSREMQAIVKACEDAPIIVCPDTGTRHRARELVDPKDLPVLACSVGGDSLFPPESYCTEPILNVLRRAGLRNLRDEQTFYDLARQIALLPSAVDAGRVLLRHLGEISKDVKWPTRAYTLLARLPIFPSYYVGCSSEPPHDASSGMPSALTLDGPCTLFRHAPIAWTQLALLDPTVFDQWPTFLLRKFGALKDPPPLEVVVANLCECAERWTATRATDSTRTTARQDIVTRHLAELKSLYKRSRGTQTMVQATLSDVAFVVLANGDLVKPTDIFAQLHNGGDDDNDHCSESPNAAKATEKSWSLPLYLKEFRSFLLSIAGPFVRSTSVPVVRVTASPPLETTLSDFILKSLNDPSLADVIFEFPPAEGAHPSTLVYAHRFVLAAGCEHFRTSFVVRQGEMGGYSESTSRHARIEMPEWATSFTLLWLLAYLYNGFDADRAATIARYLDRGQTMDQVRPRRGPLLGAEMGDELCTLLRLADMYGMEHLKQWAEQRLVAFLTADTVIALAGHAYHCSASQLLELCVYHLRLLYADLVVTAEYRGLHPSIQDSVLHGADALAEAPP